MRDEDVSVACLVCLEVELFRGAPSLALAPFLLGHDLQLRSPSNYNEPTCE